ncbi:MAG: cytochrome P450 [Burkholderiales bacterium]
MSITAPTLERPARGIDPIDVSDPALFQNHTVGPLFARLRREDPVHWCPSSRFGPYWSVTRYKDVMQVEVNHAVFSSSIEYGGITIRDQPEGYRRPSFISSDPPKHDEQRKTISPIVGPGNLAQMEATIRERTRSVLDGLPRNQTFDWVERVSIEIMKCFEYFQRLWKERETQTPRNDLVSMLAHGAATRAMPPMEFLGNVVLLIVGGNDTTRNSMSGGLHAMLTHPGEWDKLRANPTLVTSLVPEIVRWQSPVAHMRRTALTDFELGGKTIRKGDKLVMWYLSANRDEDAIEQADTFIIDRARPRQHISFGFGIHRCVGNRLAELQLKILWEEILERFPRIELAGEPRRLYSNFIHGFTSLPVRIPG